MSTAPQPIADAITSVFRSANTGETREGKCPGFALKFREPDVCGRPLKQTMIFGTWQPNLCDECALAAIEVEAERQRAEADKSRREEALKALDVPLLYRDATLATFLFHGSDDDKRRQARVLQLARRYLGMWPQRQSLDSLGLFPVITIFRGAPGSGKGHVAWSIAKEVGVFFGGRVVFTTLADCVRDLRETWRSDSEASEKQRLYRYRKADLLIIDEISRHSFYGEPTQHLYSLVAFREERLLPTILTTNESVEDLAGILGAAVESRAAGWSGVWDFGSADYRIERRKAQEAA